jgi:broad specificity phosphatase PhoE
MAGSTADPLLSAAGQARAEKLATMLRDAGIKAIYASEFHRTQDTAKPLAAKLHLDVQTMAAGDTAALVAAIKSTHSKDVVLVVGHSNTLPDAIKAFGGPAVTIRDDEYDAMFVLTPSTGTVTLIRY